MGGKRRIVALAMVVVAALVLGGCQNLPRRVAGKRCSLVGEHAQDGTWVLKCGTNKRWARVMTINDVNRAVGDWLRSQVPTTVAPVATTTPPPRQPAPPFTSFGETAWVTVGSGEGQLASGRYTSFVPAGTGCFVEVTNGSGEQRFRGLNEGPIYIDLVDGWTLTAVGPCTWTRNVAGPTAPLSSGNGMYRLGIDIEPGIYVAPGGPSCYWERASNGDGSIDSINDVYFGRGRQLVALGGSDEFFVSDGCGKWEPYTDAPDRMLMVSSAPNSYLFQGLRAFYDNDAVTVSASASSVTLGTADVFLRISAPLSGSLSEGVFSVARFTSDPTVGGIDVSSEYRGCNEITGAAEITDLVLGGDGVPTSMELVVVAKCDGSPFVISAFF